MKLKRTPVGLCLAAALLAGCSSMPDILQGEKVKYKSTGKVAPLDIPPDLTSPSRDDRYAIPESAGATTLST